MSDESAQAGSATGIGRRLAPARFLVFLAVLAVSYAIARATMPVEDWRDGIAVAFDAAALVFLASLVPLLRSHSAHAMRHHAAANDANRLLVLALSSLLTLVVMAAITGELAGASKGEWLAIVTLVGTLLLIWLFANSVYTLHYAHAFYTSASEDHGARGADGADRTRPSDRGGLDFPGTRTPDYRDFAYFAFTLGMTFQTSDVAITRSRIRIVALMHSFAAFVFNIGVIAFTINVLGGS